MDFWVKPKSSSKAAFTHFAVMKRNQEVSSAQRLCFRWWRIHSVFSQQQLCFRNVCFEYPFLSTANTIRIQHLVPSNKHKSRVFMIVFFCHFFASGFNLMVLLWCKLEFQSILKGFQFFVCQRQMFLLFLLSFVFTSQYTPISMINLTNSQEGFVI